MKKYILMIAVTLMAAQTWAADQVQSMEGVGIDGKPCKVEITRDGDSLKKISLQGASEVFEIIAETANGYFPHTHIAPQGGSEVVMDEPNIYQYFTHSNNLFSEGETFSLDTNDIPKTESTGGLKMNIDIGLNYDNGQLVSVTAQNKARTALLVTLASSKFTCEK